MKYIYFGIHFLDVHIRLKLSTFVVLIFTLILPLNIYMYYYIAVPYAVRAADTCVWTTGAFNDNASNYLNWTDCGGAAPGALDTAIIDSTSEDIVWDINTTFTAIQLNTGFSGTVTQSTNINSIFFTVDAGEKWIKLKGGVPTISFRDLVIQKERNDLVCASFGRGFYILDDFSPLREVTEEKLGEEAALYPIRDAWQFSMRSGAGSQGAGFYAAKNPEYGAVITYHISESHTSKKAKRKKEEGKLAKEKEALKFPDWEVLKEERLEEKSKIWLTIRDEAGMIVRKIEAPGGKGMHRIAWNLRYPAWGAIDIHREQRSSGSWRPSGASVMPGTYTVSLAIEVEGKITELAGPVEFKVVKLYEGALKGMDPIDAQAYRKEVNLMDEAVSAAAITLREARKKLKAMETALSRMPIPPTELNEELYQLKRELTIFEEQVYGDPAMRDMSVYTYPTVNQRLGTASGGAWSLTHGPTKTQLMCLDIAEKQFNTLKADLEIIVNDKIPAYEKKLVDAGAPWMNGMPLK